MANRRKLTADEVAAAICESRSRSEAAERLGISLRALSDYLKLHEVGAHIAIIRAERLAVRLSALDDAQSIAVRTICAIMQSEDASPSDRLKAAGLILDAGRAARAELAALDSSALNRLRNAERLDREERMEMELNVL